ncbi:MAG: Arc family DNA-binding protein [Verrucomicrobia bacterium]|nr:Arc family DNA-binding protein [Verrucomicrobiota bacterium]
MSIGRDTTRAVFYIPKQLKERIRREAENDHRSVSEWLLVAVIEKLERKEAA